MRNFAKKHTLASDWRRVVLPSTIDVARNHRPSTTPIDRIYRKKTLTKLIKLNNLNNSDCHWSRKRLHCVWHKHLCLYTQKRATVPAFVNIINSFISIHVHLAMRYCLSCCRLREHDTKFYNNIDSDTVNWIRLAATAPPYPTLSHTHIAHLLRAAPNENRMSVLFLFIVR